MKIALLITSLIISAFIQAAPQENSWAVKTYQKNEYAFKLLQLALDSTITSHGPYQLKGDDSQLSFTRSSHMLEQGEAFQIAYFGASQGEGKNLIPIKEPLYRGLLGYRLLVTNQSNKPKLAEINSLTELQKYKAGFNNQWSDFPIFKTNRLHVESAISIKNLYKMLNYGRFDYLPRSIREVDAELERFNTQNESFEVVPSIALFYPHPVYFHVSPQYSELADRIEIGLINIKLNGSFETLFLKYHKQYLDKYNPIQRNVIYLKRYHYSELPDVSWWFKPS